MQNYVILHGHFYQPPRENPWTGFVDRQISAAPFPDWNSRIHEECYAACAYSPILDYGKVTSVINCYEYLSFNFGPTLLEWMDIHGPDTVRRIIEADRISAARCHGHGNAIAQVFNHMIMPLACEKDQYTQAIWGLEEFKRRFGRVSEGLWLGETAINDAVAAVLADCGVKFVILSPFQAQSFTEGGARIEVEGGRLETGRAYKLPTKHGDLAVFFYDAPMATGISFGDLLKDCSNLENAVRGALAGKQDGACLVHTATDGEVYGHHKAFGNMALARFIDKHVQALNPEFLFTNYGAFLEENPPLLECSLLPGKDGSGTAWSCIHGVGRWREDCSCHTGGLDSWNQKWRAPLRTAFDFMRDSVFEAAERVLSPLLIDVWGARNAYFHPYVLKTDESIEEFFNTWQKKPLSADERLVVLTLMEGLRFAMLMYTSCGWFFSDISGIETIQDLLYAQCAYECFTPYLDETVCPRYLETLAEAKSNIADKGSGKDILLRAVDEFKISPKTLRCCLALQSLGGESTPLFMGGFRIRRSVRENKRGMLIFASFIYKEVCAAYKFENGVLRYIEMDAFPENITEDFWNQASSWQRLSVTFLPLFLRMDILSRNISYEVHNGYDTLRAEITLPPDAFIGLEKYLLPEEKINLESFLYYKLTAMAGRNEETLSQKGGDVFHKTIALYKILVSSRENLERISRIVAVALQAPLIRALKQKDAELLKTLRLIFWEIKDFVPQNTSILLQDAVCRADRAGAGRPYNGAEFCAEFQNLMNDLRITRE